ncbi:MAG TPA: response regulator [Rhodocyclaceae bacterium]|nr:response regulator [Rhodocyclaceae bacterium]
MTALPKLLFVDDEQELRDIALEHFSPQFSVRTAADAAAARAAVSAEVPDLAILDIRMPGEDGLSLARWLREAHPAMGIVMLTTAADVIDRIIGLELGADDYIAKPFDLRELSARIKSVLRRAAARSATLGQAQHATGNYKVRFGRCTLDLQRHRLFAADGGEIPLTAMEFDLLKVFADNPHRILNRDQLMEQAHKRGWDVIDRSIDLRIMRLRRKIELDPEKPDVLKTIRGAGYMFVPT